MRHCLENRPFTARLPKKEPGEEDGGGGGRIPRQSVMIEKARRVPSIEKLRMMIVRDEIEPLARIARGSTKGMERIASLLQDEMVAVAPTAADVLASVAAEGFSISVAAPRLQEALGNKYARRNSAAALALHYFNLSDFASLKPLLDSPEEEIRKAAAEACGAAGGAEKM